MLTTRRLTRGWLTTALVALSGCGAVGAAAHGDRDLPSSVLAGYAAVSAESSPTGSAAIWTADDGSLAAPSAALLADGRRALYATHRTSAGALRIVRSVERAARTLRFEPFEVALEPSLPWEMSSVQSASVLRDGATWWMLYAAGGAIGAARSSDGARFEKLGEPVLRVEGAALEDPCVVARPSGGYLLAYASAGSLFIASAPAPSGPWTPMGAGPIATPLALAEGGVETLADPAIVIEPTAAGRTLIAIAASSSNAATPSTIAGFGAFDEGGALRFARAERPAYSERSTAVFAGSFDRVDARTMLLWVTRAERSRTVVGALITPGGLRAGNPFVP